MFTWALIYTAATIVMAFQTSSEGLLFWRLIAGIGLGVEAVPLSASRQMSRRRRRKDLCGAGGVPKPKV